jgi:26S proteasome regulatory subunit N6
VDIHLIETKVHFELENIPKGKAALTAVKTAATSINLPAMTLADVDLVSGMISCEEKDYATAFAYFYEAQMSFTNMNQKSLGLLAIKYMLMCKIANSAFEEVFAIINSETGITLFQKHLLMDRCQISK